VYVRCHACHDVDIQLTLFNQVKNPLSAVASPAADANATEYDLPATTTTPTTMEICPVPKVRLACLCHQHCISTN
jgi:hypothetical protein